MDKYVFLLVFITFLVYFNSFGNAFVWDDLNNVVNNSQLNMPLELKDVFSKPVGRYFRPIPYLTICIDFWLWGKGPFGFHLTNFVFHLFNVILVFYLTENIMRSVDGCGMNESKNVKQISFIAALLFAVHPVHTEAVSYIAGRSDPICSFFLLVSFPLYLSFVNITSRKRIVYFSLSLILFMLALLSKEIAVMYPILIVFYDLCFVKSHYIKRIKRIMPFIGIVTCFMVFKYYFATWQTADFSFSGLYQMPKIFLYYFRLLVFPFNLHMQHELGENSILLRFPVFLSIIVFLGIVFLFVKIRRRKVILFGAGWFFIWILPFLGLVKLDYFAAEHWLYLASVGFFIIISQFRFWRLRRNKIILVLLILFFSTITMQRNNVWRDDISIYKDTLKYKPNDYKLHYNLGNSYLRRGLLDKAEREYRLVLQLSPEYAYGLNNLGLALERKGKVEESYMYYKKASVIDPDFDIAKKNILRLEFIGSVYAEPTGFDNQMYAEVLNKFLSDGAVRYKALEKDQSLLYSYLNGIAKLDPEDLNAMTQSSKIAFYINVYNAFTIKVILDNYPLKSIKDIPGVWDKKLFRVAGSDLTLNNIEHDILRKEFGEPRIHFALVCASIGCPKLASEPYSGAKLNEQLDREAKKFINDKTKVNLDKDKKRFYISSIFKWFKKDFGDVTAFISKYLPEDSARYIEENKPKIKYLKYDWSLNDKMD